MPVKCGTPPRDCIHRAPAHPLAAAAGGGAAAAGAAAARLIERLPQSLALVLDVGGVDDEVDDGRSALERVVGGSGG